MPICDACAGVQIPLLCAIACPRNGELKNEAPAAPPIEPPVLSDREELRVVFEEDIRVPRAKPQRKSKKNSVKK